MFLSFKIPLRKLNTLFCNFCIFTIIKKTLHLFYVFVTFSLQFWFTLFFLTAKHFCGFILYFYFSFYLQTFICNIFGTDVIFLQFFVFIMLILDEQLHFCAIILLFINHFVLLVKGLHFQNESSSLWDIFNLHSHNKITAKKFLYDHWYQRNW